MSRLLRSLTDREFHYCPGCSHGVIHRLIAEVIDELDIQEKTIGVCPVGCAVMANEYFNFDTQQAAHGRAPAVATGIKRMLPDRVVFTYQGDGDLAAIGIGEFIHAVARSENLTTIFVNNAIYGMTGGQMAPTTLLGQQTATTPTGRSSKQAGFPLRIAEMAATISGAAYVTRVSVHSPGHIRAAKTAIRTGFQNQLDEKGYSLIEILAACPTNLGLSPADALAWVEQQMVPYFPLGEFSTTERMVQP